MGYCTNYSLQVRKVGSEERFNQLQSALAGHDLIGYAFIDGRYNEQYKEAEFLSYDSVKWYDHAEDMVMISEKFPEMYFELEGDGDDYGDFWKEYYHDGECEVCRGEIVYEQPKKVQWNELIRF